MSIGSLTNISSSYLQSLIASTLGTQSTTPKGSNATTTAQNADTNQLSPFAQLLSTLQQLQQSNPTQYSQVTQQIASNLTTAANTAQASGNTTAAGALNQLATDFTNASQNNQLPSIQDLATAMQGHGHHHHHHGGAHGASGSSGSSTDGSSSSSTGSTASDMLSQLISSYQSTAANTQSVDPMSIITSTLAGAGIDL